MTATSLPVRRCTRIEIRQTSTPGSRRTVIQRRCQLTHFARRKALAERKITASGRFSPTLRDQRQQKGGETADNQ
jgi:hypothetical protein